MSAQPDDDLSPAWQRIGAVVWPSFFAACVSTLVFFAVVDPVDLAGITWTRVEISREAGYSLGFFMFWVATFSASAFTALLLVRAPARRIAREDDDA
jgi:hypothetical protein